MTLRVVGLVGISLAMPFAVSADIRITEIMYDVPGSDAKREWIELYNDSEVAIDISKLKVTDSSAHVLNAPPKNGGIGSLVIAPRSYAVIAADAATFRAEYPSVAVVIDSVLNLPNSGASLSLGAASVAYEKRLGAAGDGQSLQYADGSWIHANPTPGSRNAAASLPIVQEKKPATKEKKSVASAAYASADARVSDVHAADEPVPKDANVPVESGGIGWRWWIAVSALALTTASLASIIMHERRNEWVIVDESE